MQAKSKIKSELSTNVAKLSDKQSIKVPSVLTVSNYLIIYYLLLILLIRIMIKLKRRIIYI